jgi:S-DNA-T family DNA segregation ATPase FtsK/SpoIIIE
MNDPEGNEFCLCTGGQSETATPAADRSGRRQGAGVTRCGECGFDYDAVPEEAIGASLRAETDAFVKGLSAGDLRKRPSPEVWSALEYACHVRDVLQVQIGRVARGLGEETPSFRPMQRDERAARLRYNEQDPLVVREQLLDAATALAEVFDGLDEAQLARTVTYNWPAEMVRPLRWVGRHTVHELLHHRLDVERGLGRSG